MHAAADQRVVAGQFGRFRRSFAARDFVGRADQHPGVDAVVMRAERRIGQPPHADRRVGALLDEADVAVVEAQVDRHAGASPPSACATR
jgi:hypothetical protein